MPKKRGGKMEKTYDLGKLAENFREGYKGLMGDYSNYLMSEDVKDFHLFDIIKREGEVKYRKGSEAEWQHVCRSQLLNPASAGLPTSLIKETRGDLGRIELIDEGDLVHVYLDKRYKGALMKNLEADESERNPVRDTQADQLNSMIYAAAHSLIRR